MKKFIIIIALLTAFNFSNAQTIGGVITDKIENVFTSFFDLFSADKENRIEFYDHIESMMLTQYPDYFLYFETDFNNDGNKYLWVSHNKNEVGSGYFFNLYKKNEDRYELLPDYAIFTPEYLAFTGKNFTADTQRLLTYSRISGQEGNLVVYNVKDDKITSFVYKTIEPLGADSEIFDKLFPEENTFVKEIPTDKFLDFLKDRSIASPKKEHIEFLAFDLGGKTGVVMLATNPEESIGASGWSAYNLKREDTILNDIGLNAIGIDLSLDRLLPFEIRNPGWKKLEIFPEGRKIIFFKNYSFIREINKRKFLITLNREGLDKTSITFYQLSFSRICAFDISNIRIKENDDETDDDSEKQAYDFLKALDFDLDADSKYFHYQLYPAKEVVYNHNDITIPKDLDVDNNIYDIKKITLPENNKYTEEFNRKWSDVRQKAKAKQTRDNALNPAKQEPTPNTVAEQTSDKKEDTSSKPRRNFFRKNFNK